MTATKIKSHPETTTKLKKLYQISFFNFHFNFAPQVMPFDREQPTQTSILHGTAITDPLF
jgi:hypothetical protein